RRPCDDTARTKILDRTPYRNCQQPDRLCNCSANVTAWLYSSNLFCICIYAFNIRSWLKEQTHTDRDQVQKQQFDSVADELRMSPAMQHRTDAGTATEGGQVSNRNAENRYPIGP